MRVLQYGDEVWVMRNKKQGLKLKKKETSFGICKGCCFHWTVRETGKYGCLKYGHLLTDICNEEKIIFRITHEDSKK